MDLTPQFLVDKGFKHQSFGIGGQDMWAGLGFWEHSNGLILRGNISSTGRGSLHLYPYFNTMIETKKQLEDLLNIFR